MFQSLRRVVTIAALFCALALTLAGCVHVDRSVKLKSDGSGTYTLNLGLSDQLVRAGGSSLVSQMNACGATAKSQGADFTSSDQDGYTTWSFTWSFSNVDKLNDLLRTAPQGCDTSGASSAASSNSTDFFRVTRHASGFTSSFHVTGQMSFTLDTSAANNPAATQLLQDARESFAITLPGGISSHSGGVVRGDTITYTVHVNETAKIDVTSKSLNAAALYPLIGGFAIILILFGAMVVVYRRRSHSGAAGNEVSVERDDTPTLPGRVAEPAPVAPPVNLGAPFDAAADAPTQARHDDPTTFAP